jgi:hypothetical protein
MKLARIPSVETTVKHSFSFRQSTAVKLEAYQKLYEKTHGQEVTMKDLVEQMLVIFMDGDKDFERYLREQRDQESRPPAAEAGQGSKPPAAAAERHSNPPHAAQSESPTDV